MIEKYVVSEKNKDLAYDKLLSLTGCDINDLYLKESEEEAKLFKGKKFQIEAFKKQDVLNYVKDYIKSLGNFMNIEINMEVKYLNDSINVLLVSDNNNILIGKNGKTIDAIQTLLKQSLKVQLGMNVKIYVDASNYKEKKIKRKMYEIKQIAREVQNTKIDAKLDPMNSYERRMIHTLIDGFKNLKTESVGEEPNRYVVIKYDDKAS